jgi:hypothetical protein
MADRKMDGHLGALRTQACVIRTSVEALINQTVCNAFLRWDEALHQFNTLTRQLDDLRDEIVALPLLGYFVLAPGARLPENPDELPFVLSTRELPAMEALSAARAEASGAAVPFDAHNALVDDVTAILEKAETRSRPPPPASKRRRVDAPADRATAWPAGL